MREGGRGTSPAIARFCRLRLKASGYFHEMPRKRGCSEPGHPHELHLKRGNEGASGNPVRARKVCSALGQRDSIEWPGIDFSALDMGGV